VENAETSDEKKRSRKSFAAAEFVLTKFDIGSGRRYLWSGRVPSLSAHRVEH
jgi:hypothetical protein